MNFKRKSSYVIVFIFIDILLCASLYFIIDATNINLLKKEITSLSKLDISVDKINKDSKTYFKYRIVDNTIKDFLNDYSYKINEVYEFVDDDKLIKILSYDNYLNDGPEFNDSKHYLVDRKIKFNNIINELEKILEEDNIKKLIRNKITNEYYITLYDEMIFSDEFNEQFENNRIFLKELRDKYNNIYDTSLEVLNFLSLYKDSWKLENGEIKFINNDLLNYYNSLISKIS